MGKGTRTSLAQPCRRDASKRRIKKQKIGKDGYMNLLCRKNVAWKKWISSMFFL